MIPIHKLHVSDFPKLLPVTPTKAPSSPLHLIPDDGASSDPRKELLYPRLSPEQWREIAGYLEGEQRWLEDHKNCNAWRYRDQNRLDDVNAILGEINGWLKGDQ